MKGKEDLVVTSSGRHLSVIRFMQMLLAMTLLFSLAYMYQFVSVSFSFRSMDESVDAKERGLLRNRVLGHSVVHLQGFEAGHKFVSEYDVESQGPLYILFMSDANADGEYWCPDCERAKKPVMDAFKRAPRGSRLAEIRVGPQAYWADYMNEFRQNQLFYLDYIPTLLRYEGGGNSSTMLTEAFCTDPALLDYVFRVHKPLAGAPHQNTVLSMSSPNEVIDYLGTYDNTYPLFFFFVSGYHNFNGRLWCPYCDRADVAVMHYFNYTAPETAVLVRVTTADSYEAWKSKANPFRQPAFQEKVGPMRAVPYLGFVKKDVPGNKVTLYQFLPDYTETAKLQTFFKNKPRTAKRPINVFMIRFTTMRIQTLGGQEREQESSDRLVQSGQERKKSDVDEGDELRSEKGQADAEEKANNAMEDREHRQGEEKEDGVTTKTMAALGAYDSPMLSKDVGGIFLADNTKDNDVEKARDVQHVTNDDKKTALEVIPIAANESQVTERPTEVNGSASTPMNAPLTQMDNVSHPLWTRVDKLPIAGDDTVSNSTTRLTTTTGAGPNQVMPLSSLQDVPSLFTSSRFDQSRFSSKTAEQSTASIPLEQRHAIVSGYNMTLAYLEKYRKPADSKEELFLFFTCSDDKGGQDDWTPNCVYAREKVYATFATSPSTSRLLTIYTGPRDYWLSGNAFKEDDDLHLKAIPTVMRWDGGAPTSLRSTWGVLIAESVLHEPLLRYLFRSLDEQDKLLGRPEVATKEIIKMKGYAQYRKRMETYAREGLSFPLFLMMSSGRLEHNHRLWCPWSRQSEMSIEYAFYAYAPPNAKLLVIETYDTLSEWRNPLNEFKTDPQLEIKGVPWFYRIYPDAPGKPLRFERILEKKFYLLENLQHAFEDK
ncbi:hypothetical protein PsorP6_000594 [Peronosclerospora sorghi]|uniref:Uncharacterized protein n=1 Tax=Peronosclerospora sorghi TaxID=230839 RepID=A0ACC0WYC4_9STRA|nr:hypothetical protein PsorP6_000594 [Peronosclerospora sorghi]